MAVYWKIQLQCNHQDHARQAEGLAMFWCLRRALRRSICTVPTTIKARAVKTKLLTEDACFLMEPGFEADQPLSMQDDTTKWPLTQRGEYLKIIRGTGLTNQVYFHTQYTDQVAPVAFVPCHLCRHCRRRARGEHLPSQREGSESRTVN